MPGAADPTRTGGSGGEDDGVRAEVRLGLALRRAREERGLSLRALAGRLHRAHSNLHDYEKGNRLPPADVVQAYESVLQVPSGSLTGLHRRVTDELDAAEMRLPRPRPGAPGAARVEAGQESETKRSVRSPRGDRRRSYAVVGFGTLAGLAAVTGVVFVASDRTNGASAVISVYNIEAGCQVPRTDNCRLGLARDPYARYTRENVVGYVWHGDRLVTDCFISNGAQVEAEDRTFSTRWYRVSVPEGLPAAPPNATAWLPGIRLRSGLEPAVAQCS